MYREMINDAGLALLNQGVCPDCEPLHGDAVTLVAGPRGGMSQNMACWQCGAEYNVGWWNGVAAMAHRNSPPGRPNRTRLAEVFGITLPAGGETSHG